MLNYVIVSDNICKMAYALEYYASAMPNAFEICPPCSGSTTLFTSSNQRKIDDHNFRPLPNTSRVSAFLHGTKWKECEMCLKRY